MTEYHKIQTIFKRDEKTNFKTLLYGQYSIPEFEYLKDNQWLWLEKIDGMNLRILWDGSSVTFAGKTNKADIPKFMLEKLTSLFDSRMFKEKFYEGSVCLYGEGYGNKIQKVGNSYISTGVNFILFDCKIGHWWMERESLVDIADYFNIDVVPIIGAGTLNEAIEHCKAGFKSVISEDKDLNAEGLVLKPAYELFALNGHRIITKIKTKDFQS